ncbi:MAG: helix-turn-helix domain-containing protein [Oscillospiraceae bacterium]|nr:helix-turn-helix domain-containing protein [Oscillospiraceae bacterium]
MDNKVLNIKTVIDYIEDHLDTKLDLETVAEAVHYSKYHLHRMFSETVGMTVHDYVQRRQLTEAAKLLVFSDKPVIDLALMFGFKSPQAFSLAFKQIYKSTPSDYRENRVFYPLQLRFDLIENVPGKELSKEYIHIAKRDDIPEWMDLMRMVIDGYPGMNEEVYRSSLIKAVDENRALVMRDGDILAGAMIFSEDPPCIDFFGIHPQYRRRGLEKMFLDAMMERVNGSEISATTYREGDRADTGYRDLLKQLGFAERELLTEYGYPTQRFVYDSRRKDEENETVI